MIVCRRCSRQHGDDTEFCTCGAYLEIDGDVLAVDDSPPATTSPNEATVARPEPSAPIGNQDASSPWSELSAAGTSGPAADSMAVRPTSSARRGERVESFEPHGAPRSGDIVCAACGAANPAGSSMCRRCVNNLTGQGRIIAEHPDRQPRRSWFRRHAPDTGRVYQRARRHRGLARRVIFMRAGGATAFIAVAIAMLGPWGGVARGRLGDGLQLDRLQRYDQIEVDGDDVTAVLQDGSPATNVDYPYQPPELAVDYRSNTAWATRWIDPADLGERVEELEGAGCLAGGTEQRLVVEFASPVDIDRVQIVAGRSADDPTREEIHRPRVLQFAHDDVCRLVSLDDDGTLMARDLSFDDVTTLVVEIVAIYAGESTDPTVEITEIVFEQA